MVLSAPPVPAWSCSESRYVGGSLRGASGCWQWDGPRGSAWLPSTGDAAVLGLNAPGRAGALSCSRMAAAPASPACPLHLQLAFLSQLHATFLPLLWDSLGHIRVACTRGRAHVHGAGGLFCTCFGHILLLSPSGTAISCCWSEEQGVAVGAGSSTGCPLSGPWGGRLGPGGRYQAACRLSCGFLLLLEGEGVGEPVGW